MAKMESMSNEDTNTLPELKPRKACFKSAPAHAPVDTHKTPG